MGRDAILGVHLSLNFWKKYIIKSPRLEKASKIIQSNHPPTTNISPLNRVPQYHISMFLVCLQAYRHIQAMHVCVGM